MARKMDAFLSQADALWAELWACELGVWEALRTGNIDSDAAVLAGDFLGVYTDGFAGKSDHVAQLSKGPSIQVYAIDGFRARRIGDDYALVVYRAVFTRHARDSEEVMYVTSIWQRASPGWINVFSQDTPSNSVPIG